MVGNEASPRLGKMLLAACRASLLVLAVSQLAACGGGAAQSGSPPAKTSPSASISSSASGLQVTEADNGKTISMVVSQTVFVELHAPDGFQLWQVATPDPQVLSPVVNPGATAVRGATLRAFKAVAPGQTDITATSRPICQPGEACPQLVRGFKVTVVVRSS